jgi:hypothetical protein
MHNPAFYSGCTFVALDVDGVVNHFSKSARNSGTGQISEYPIKWRPEMLDELRTRLTLPNVVGVWLTTWLQSPELLDELEEMLGLKGFVPLRADYPHMMELGWGGAKVLMNSRFEGMSLNSGNSRWWKYRSAEMVLEEYKPERFVWLDDELGRNTGKLDPWHPRPVTYERLLLKTDPVAGLLPENFVTLDNWLKMEKTP